MSELPPLPPGYALDAMPPLPPGYALDSGGADVSANNLARSAATGVPIVGGVLNKLDAATNAALAPVLNPLFDKKDQLNEPTFGERYEHSKRIQEGMDKSFESAHPILDTTAKLVGGVASTAPLMAAAPGAFGLTGTVPQMVAKGAASGAALNATDAAVRGENPITAAETGGIIGGAAGPAGKLVGKAVSAIADRIRPPEAVPQNMARVGNTDIPLTESQVTGNPAASSEEQILLRGGRGEPAQNVAQKALDLQEQRINQAKDEVGAGLDTRSKTLDQRLDAMADERGALATEEYQGRPNQKVPEKDAALHNALSVASLPGWNHERSLAAAKWAAENGRQDIAQAIVDRAQRGAETASITPGVSRDNPKYEAIAADLVEGRQKSLREAAAIQEATGLKPTTGTPVARIAPQAAGEHVAGELGQSEQARQAVRALQDGSLGFERENIGAALDPTGKRVATTPDQAGEVVANAARQQAAQTAARAEQEAQAVTRNHEATRRNLAGGPVADDAHHAAELVSNATQQAAEAARGRTTAAYNAMRDEPGEFNPVVFRRMGQSIRQRLSTGDDQVHVNPTTTPFASQALHDLDRNISGQNQATPQRAVRLPDGRVVPARRPITGTTIDEARKNLVSMASDARAAALRTGNQSDVRAMRRVIDAFEGHVSDSVNAGAFSGDGERLLELQGTARGLHSTYRQTFTSQGGGDKVGRVIEEIVGRRGIDPAPAPRVATAMYGSEAKPGGAQAVQVAQRLRQMFGENSPQWGAYKQGLFSHITENAAGRTPEEVADRIHGFLESTHSRALAQVAFSPEERLALTQYADHARTQAPVARAATDKVGKELERIVGEGGQPATPNGVADTLFGKSGIGDQEISAKLARHVRDTYGPNSPEFSAVRQGMWHSITESPGGKLDLNSNKVADRIAEHVNGRGKSTADILFTPAERSKMLEHAGKLRASAPKEGDEIDKVIGRITGRDGGLPASPTEVADFLYGRSGAGDKGVSVKLAQRLKRQLSPEGFNAVRQGMWTKLTEPTEGRLDWGPQKIAERMHEFLNGNGSPLSHVLYTSEERALMKKLAGVYKQMIPVKGTTNPSGTAPMLAKIAGGARHTLLPLLGFTHGGVPGAAVAYGMDKGLSALSNAKSARRATELFYGPQAKRPINPVYSKAARLIAQSALTQSNQH